MDLRAKKFELEMISKDGGYVRTVWAHGSRGETENYRVLNVAYWIGGG